MPRSGAGPTRRSGAVGNELWKAAENETNRLLPPLAGAKGRIGLQSELVGAVMSAANPAGKVSEKIVELSEQLPPEKQTEVLDFVSFLVSRQASNSWTPRHRREVVARTMGSLAFVPSGSHEFARRKAAEKAKEGRRWKP